MGLIMADRLQKAVCSPLLVWSSPTSPREETHKEKRHEPPPHEEKMVVEMTPLPSDMDDTLALFRKAQAAAEAGTWRHPPHERLGEMI
jgi:hypothetical protein